MFLFVFLNYKWICNWLPNSSLFGRFIALVLSIDTGISLYCKLLGFCLVNKFIQFSLAFFALYGHTPVLLHTVLQAFSIHIAFFLSYKNIYTIIWNVLYLNLTSLNSVCHSRTNSNGNFSNQPTSITYTQTINYLASQFLLNYFSRSNTYIICLLKIITILCLPALFSLLDLTFLGEKYATSTFLSSNVPWI